MKNRIVWIDAIRVICTFYIVGFWHLSSILYSSLPMNNFTYQTTYCVLATFTLISGFFSASSHLNNVKDIVAWYIKKLIRIYPLLTLACISFLIIGYMDVHTFIRCQLGIGIFFKAPRTLWYICMIMIFYFFTPFVLRINNFFLKIVIFLIIEIAFYLLYCILGMDERVYFYWIFFCIGLFIKENNYHTLINKNYSFPIFSTILYFVISSRIGQSFNMFTVICAFSFIYSIASITYFILGRFQKVRVLEFLSYSSMCAYLFHRPIYACLYKIHGPFNLITAYVICIPIVVILSYLVQKIYDKFICYIENNYCR